MRIAKSLITALLLAVPFAASAQPPANQEAVAAILKADRDFAKSVADRDRNAFLSFIADVATFNGGTRGEIRGRDAVWNEWQTFFEPNGPTITWAPRHAEVIGSGDLGYTTGLSVSGRRGADGKSNIVERRGEYLSVWRKQADGSWKVVFDTGSTLP